MSSERARGPAKATFNILFVCTGNTCRSPMAEAVARDELARRGWQHVQVASAGISASFGSGASPEALAVLGRRGIDLGDHRSQPLSPELVDWADLILAMTPSHAVAAARLGGDDKVALLGEFAAGDDGAYPHVTDPFGGTEEVYEETLRQLHFLISASLDRLAPILHP